MKVGKAGMATEYPVRLLVLEGTAYEMGHAHGQWFTKSLQECARVFGQYCQNLFGLKRDIMVAHGQRLESMIPAHLREEMQGIADGAQIPYSDVLILNTAVETALLHDPEAVFCTNCALMPSSNEEGLLYLGRNADYKNARYLAPLNCVICRKAGPFREYATIAMALAGQVGGATFLNSNKQAISFSTSYCMTPGSLGIPVLLALRVAAETTAELNQALAALEEQPLACAYNFLLADGGAGLACSLEAQPGSTARVFPDTSWLAVGGTRLSPRPKKEQLVAPADVIRQIRTLQLLAAEDVHPSLESMQRLLADRFDLLTQQHNLSQRCICNYSSLHSLAADLTTGCLRISLGPPPAPLHPYVSASIDEIVSLSSGSYLLTGSGVEICTQETHLSLLQPLLADLLRARAKVTNSTSSQ